MPHTIFLQDFINHLVAEMSIAIYDQCSWGVEPCENVAMKELDYHTGIIRACRYCLYPFGDVVHNKENIQVTEWRGEWTHEVHPP